jgi:hypothetical protein
MISLYLADVGAFCEEAGGLINMESTYYLVIVFLV